MHQCAERGHESLRYNPVVWTAPLPLALTRDMLHHRAADNVTGPRPAE